ncbi:protein MpMTPSL27 [Marchantia polymorpha subsp. ruderalis]|uniref:Uncharacterized protein n=2 Tax=Marchantia polymorpha TaxID=3197 RepID=A0AAF6AXK9_MARPO|nr:hypothetical protein MARPO_0022s0015 [Marchantia polymorpha]BBN04493.1 hypothetical protein Mp_3g05130 [Marchantia polymorpha subsp. ruderalis]|eukprot:PTQ43907.1 hypothetical protein MARPO_0022s0015 [Marchantia polymorpha]
MADYLTLRRGAGCVPAFLVFVDRIIEHKRANRLPDSLFYGEDMQNLLAACSDIVCWHNDIFSFQRVRSA